MKTGFVIVSLVVLIASCGAATASEYASGTGFLISPKGLILTNRHVVEDCEGPITATYVTVGSRQAEIVVMGKGLDLAVLTTNSQDVPYLKLRASEGTVDLPVLKEQVHTFGFHQGGATPHGGLIWKLSSNVLGELAPVGAVIDTNSGPGASGSPVVDDSGLVLGIIWLLDHSDPDRVRPHMINSVGIYLFLEVHGIQIELSEVGPHPNPNPKPKDVKELVDHLADIVGLLFRTTVRITCPVGGT